MDDILDTLKEAYADLKAFQTVAIATVGITPRDTRGSSLGKITAAIKHLEQRERGAPESEEDLDRRATEYAALNDRQAARIAELEDELANAERAPWPEWAKQVLKIIRKHSGYDGYDDTNGVDLPEELGEVLSEYEHQLDSAHTKLATARTKLDGFSIAREGIAASGDRVAEAIAAIGDPPPADRCGFCDGKREIEDTEKIMWPCLICRGKTQAVTPSASSKVDRFLDWKLPQDFAPDAGISFKKDCEHESAHWPTGRNLLTADQAKAMFEYCLAGSDEARPSVSTVTPIPDGWQWVPKPLTEEMHIAACKVLLRAPGLDGLPQRMLAAMLATAPTPPQQPRPESAIAADVLEEAANIAEKNEQENKRGGDYACGCADSIRALAALKREAGK